MVLFFSPDFQQIYPDYIKSMTYSTIAFMSKHLFGKNFQTSTLYLFFRVGKTEKGARKKLRSKGIKIMQQFTNTPCIRFQEQMEVKDLFVKSRFRMFCLIIFFEFPSSIVYHCSMWSSMHTSEYRCCFSTT
jgi:hypothetical protein